MTRHDGCTSTVTAASAATRGVEVMAVTGDGGAMPRAAEVMWAMLRQRCPRWHRGRMFHGSFAMNDPCPECGLLFQREEGYFLGAMYVSYGLSVVLIGAAYLAVTSILPDAGPSAVLLLSAVLY